MTEEISEHDRIFQEAVAIAKDHVALHGKPNLPVPNWWLEHKLKRAIVLLKCVLEINPENWSAMWYIGKIHQRFHNQAEALLWFDRSYQINPSQPDVAREASICAMNIGSHDTAIAFAYRAIQIEPTNYGLHSNLALAYLVAGRIHDAELSITKALAGNPSDKIGQTIQKMICHFNTNGKVPPTTTPALLNYWNKISRTH